MTLRSFQTNEFTEEIHVLVGVSNGSSHALDLAYAVQILTAQGWAHTNGMTNQLRLVSDDDSRVLPGGELIQFVPAPASTNLWRVLVSYSKAAEKKDKKFGWLRGEPIPPLQPPAK